MFQHDPPHDHRPGGPVLDSGLYAAVTPDNRTVTVRHIPAGATFPFIGERDVRYVRAGLPEAISH